ncbi:MAG: hypothetical protein LUG61_01550 [Lachnospiraceae bacterium]|nr:hypothetical protein [Lachnospiraceae bacterium]
MTTKKKEETVVEIRPLEIAKATITIVGDSPLIMRAWSEKAKRMMLEAQMGKKKGKAKEPKNPEEDFIDSLYWMTPKPEEKTMEAFEAAVAAGAKFAIPVTAIKQAAISAAYRQGWIKNKMEMRGAFYIDSDENGMVEIKSDPPIMREDMVKVGMGTADIRYRGELRNWSVDLTISYNLNGQYDLTNIINTINAGGYVCGIGEWRPERDGQYGMFHVATS